VRIGESVAANGLEGSGAYLAARDLLLRMGPRLGGQALQRVGRESLRTGPKAA